MNNYVSREQVDSKVSDIRGFCNSYIKKLEEIFAKVESVYYKSVTVKEFNHVDVEGSKREVGKILGVFGEGKKVKDVFVIPDNNIANCYDVISKEIEELIGRFNNILELLDSMGESMEMIAIYMLKIEETLAGNGQEVSDLDKYLLAKQLMERDMANGYELLHSTPILEDFVDERIMSGSFEHSFYYTGKGFRYFNEYGANVVLPLATFLNREGDCNYYTDEEIQKRGPFFTSYYVEIMKKANIFTDLHKNALTNLWENLYLKDNAYYVGYGGVTSYCDIEISFTERAYEWSDLSQKNYIYPRIDYFVHETGHIFDNYYGKKIIEDGKEVGYYKFCAGDEYYDFYKAQLETPHPGVNVSWYSTTSLGEHFAEFITAYYGDERSYDYYSPEVLKDLEVTFDNRTMTAYEVIDNVLNKGKVY